MEQVDMNYEIYTKAIDSLRNLKHIELQGEGEPFLYPRIFDMIEYARSKQIKVSMISNGSLFSDENIDSILKSGLNHILISIESPVEHEFKRIRNGDLNIVIEGIKKLISERNRRKLNCPAIGFIVTVLKSTMHLLPRIVELYKQLGMDGGISAQGLNDNKFYSQFYNSDLTNEYITEKEYKSVTDYLEVITAISNTDKSKHHFYQELFEDSSHPTNCPNCIWINKALYINAYGDVTSCCLIKDVKKFSIGKINNDRIEDIIILKNKMKESLKNENIPECCLGCPNIKGIQSRTIQIAKT